MNGADQDCDAVSSMFVGEDGGGVGVSDKGVAEAVLCEWLHLLRVNPRQLPELHSACQRGNLVAIMKHINNPPAGPHLVNHVTASCRLTPLFFACLEGQSNVVDLLLYRHAALVIPPNHLPSASPLALMHPPSSIHAVCVTGDADILTKLLRHVWKTLDFSITEDSPKYDPFSDKFFVHPFILACLSGNSAIVDRILQFYSDFTSVNLGLVTSLGLNLVHAAVLSDNCNFTHFLLSRLGSELVEELIDQQVQVSKSFPKLTPDVKREVTSLINSNGMLSEACRHGYTPLVLAARMANEQMCRLLLSWGADPLAACDDNELPTALHHAASSGCDQLVCTLMMLSQADPEHSACPPTGCFSNNTPLHAAVKAGQLSVCLKLMELGADANLRDFHGMLPVHYACVKGNVHIFNALLHKTRNITTERGDNGYTALHLACISSSDQIITALLRLGADVGARDRHDGCTCLHLALEFCHWDIFQVLLQCNASKIHLTDNQGQSLLHYAVKLNRPAIVDALLAMDACEVNWQDADGNTPLHLSCHPDLCDLLLAHGGDLNRVNSRGHTPVHSAVIKGESGLVRHLLAQPSFHRMQRPESEGTEKRPPSLLHLACSHGDKRMMELVEIVLERTDIDVNQTISVSLDTATSICSSAAELSPSTLAALFDQSEFDTSLAAAPEEMVELTALNLCVKPKDDNLTLLLLSKLVEYGARECDLKRLLESVIENCLHYSTNFLLAIFMNEVDRDLLKHLLFFAIKKVNLPVFHQLLDNFNVDPLEICPVAHPFEKERIRERKLTFHMLLYPIEMCIISAACQNKSPTPFHTRVDAKIRDLSIMFDELYPLYKRTESIAKFDFFHNRAMLTVVLRHACNLPKLFHMLTRWLNLNRVAPTALFPDFIASSRNNPVRISFFSTLFASCGLCRGYWCCEGKGVWREFFSRCASESPLVSSMDEVLIAYSLNFLQPSDLVEVISGDDIGLLPDGVPLSLQEQSALAVRRAINPVLLLTGRFLEHMPRHLHPILNRGFTNLPGEAKKRLTQYADELSKLTSHPRC